MEHAEHLCTWHAACVVCLQHDRDRNPGPDTRCASARVPRLVVAPKQRGAGQDARPRCVVRTRRRQRGHRGLRRAPKGKTKKARALKQAEWRQTIRACKGIAVQVQSAQQAIEDIRVALVLEAL
jgi:hypothetical protein